MIIYLYLYQLAGPSFLSQLHLNQFAEHRLDGSKLKYEIHAIYS